MPRYKVIVNPISGRGAGERAVPLIKQLLQSHGLDFDLVCTERPWHAAELAQQAVQDGYDIVVAVGGDGTANEVLNGLMLARQAGLENRVAMGILSVGRGNDFAFGVGVPRDLKAGCRTLAQNHRRPIDVGRVVGGPYPQGRYFGNGVGIGFDAVVGFEALKMKRLHGFPSYIVAALKTIFLYYRAPLVHIEYDGETITQPSLLISIMNGRRMGGGFLMAPHAEHDDGLFDLCIASQVSRARIFALIPRFMNGTQATQKSIRTGRTRHITVTAVEGVLPAHADGETLCTEGQRLDMELLPRQIEILYQPPEADQ
ncbi:MAG: diacylglycerol kinase family lipid kinase [Anaerolineae bacterium]|nr:diacylglycerol kinase family lipid kinase [Anaerolineae bacterium]